MLAGLFVMLFACGGGSGVYEVEGLSIPHPATAACSTERAAGTLGFTIMSNIPVEEDEAVLEVSCGTSTADEPKGHSIMAGVVMVADANEALVVRMDRLPSLFKGGFNVEGPATRTINEPTKLVEVQSFAAGKTKSRRLLHLELDGDRILYKAYSAHPDVYDEAKADAWFKTVKFPER